MDQGIIKLLNKAGKTEEILTKGTPKQRVLLLANHIAGLSIGEPGILSEEEFNNLVSSFKTDKERALYYKFKKLEENMRTALSLLFQYKNAYREQIAIINGYCLLWESYYLSSKLIFNLKYVIEDEEARNNYINSVLDKHDNFLTRNIINIDRLTYTPDRVNLLAIIDIHKRQAKNLLVEFKTLLTAIRASIKENGFRIKPHIKRCNMAEKEIMSIVSTIPKETTIKEEPETLSKKSEKHYVYPDYKALEIDENRYKHYREKVI